MDARELKRRFRKAFAVYSRISSRQEIDGFTPSFIVGERNYPRVPVFFMSSEEPVESRPDRLFGKGLEELVGMRMSMVGSMKRQRLRESVREEIAMSVVPPATEVELRARPVLMVRHGFHQPIFIQARLRGIKVTSFKIPEKMEKIVSDEMRAVEMAREIYGKFGLYKAHELMSAGLLGVDKRIVPTRWAITAVDDSIGKGILEKVRQYRVLERAEMYSISYLSNHFLLILLPSEWSFEMVEQWIGSEPIQDYEGFYGRRDYARNVEGAYYAARLAVLEELDRRKRQAKAIVLRKVDAGYSVPMGVWVIRESIRRIFGNRVEEIPDGFRHLLEKSVIYRRHLYQKKLTDF